jgi:HAD superfamily hydrolase (TIGR01450 family)
VPTDFSPYAAVLLDLDGTIYHEDHALPGAVNLIRSLQNNAHCFACLSNSTSSPERIMKRLQTMGLDLEPEQIYTAAAAACDFVLTDLPRKQSKPRIFNLASEAVGEMLEGSVDWVRTGDEPCDGIIVGTSTNVFATEDRQRIALQLARRGATVLGICADRVYPSPRGVEFGAGALAWMLAYAANVTPIFAGKPQKIFFDELCRRLSVQPSACLLIGDNLESDVMGARAVGMKTVLTMTGVTGPQELAAVTEDRRPDFIVADLNELKGKLE